jgi:hypothetical protein
VGLDADKVWRSFDAEKIKGDFSRFRDWFWEYGWPLLGMIEELVSLPAGSRKEESAFRPGRRLPLMLGPSGAPQPRAAQNRTNPEELSGRSPEAAQRIVQEATESMRSPAPWDHPRQQLDLLKDAALEALALDPESSEAQTLASEVDCMRTRLSAFEGWFGAQMDGDESTWSPTMNEAFAASADDMRPETVRGHAVRLFLTTHPSVKGEAESGSAPKPDHSAAQRAETVPECPDPCAGMERSHLTVVPTLEPSASERAENLF